MQIAFIILAVITVIILSLIYRNITDFEKMKKLTKEATKESIESVFNQHNKAYTHQQRKIDNLKENYFRKGFEAGCEHIRVGDDAFIPTNQERKA